MNFWERLGTSSAPGVKIKVSSSRRKEGLLRHCRRSRSSGALTQQQQQNVPRAMEIAGQFGLEDSGWKFCRRRAREPG
jgi:hypothetical protein